MKTFVELLSEANAEIKTITSEQLHNELGSGNLVIVDVQSRENVLNSGMIPGAIHAERGMLEFFADQRAENPFRKKELDPTKKIVVYCGAGGQGALATKTLQDMGFPNVHNLSSGTEAWTASGFDLQAVNDD